MIREIRYSPKVAERFVTTLTEREIMEAVRREYESRGHKVSAIALQWSDGESYYETWKDDVSPYCDLTVELAVDDQ